MRLVEADLEVTLKDCARELIVWSSLSHPNILPLLGIYRSQYRSGGAISAFVSPFMENRDLAKFLQNEEGPDRHSLILDIISGLAYLHSQKPPVIHADLKSANIFVSSTRHALIGDYGMSYIIHSAQKRETRTDQRSNGKTLNYSAPELMEDDVPMSRSRDIFAFGCVIFEMYSGKA
ncbi:kinase-like protein, partial [Coniophora puteana RWD-64-598 SS2]